MWVLRPKKTLSEQNVAPKGEALRLAVYGNGATDRKEAEKDEDAEFGLHLQKSGDDESWAQSSGPLII